MGEVEKVVVSDALYERLLPVYMQIVDRGVKDRVHREYERLWHLGNSWGFCLQGGLLKEGLIQVEPVPMDDAEYEEILACQDAMEGL